MKSGQAGRITWVSSVLLLAMASTAYALLVFGPIYFEHWEVKQIVRDVGNRAVKSSNDAELQTMLVNKVATLITTTVEQNGRKERVPVILLDPGQIIWERIADPPSLRIAFQYTRQVHLPFFNRDREKTFDVDMTMDIAKPDWGPIK
jgi:hypothetical protein